MMMVECLGGGGWQWRCRSQCWPGQLGRTLGWQERAAGLAASSGLGAGVEQGLGEQLRNRLWLRSARR
jgi:hypothetical protein